MVLGQMEWSYLIGFTCFKTCFEAEEEESPGDDVEQEGEADAKGCEEHRADRMSASRTENIYLIFTHIWNRKDICQLTKSGRMFWQRLFSVI